MINRVKHCKSFGGSAVDVGCMHIKVKQRQESDTNLLCVACLLRLFVSYIALGLAINSRYFFALALVLLSTWMCRAALSMTGCNVSALFKRLWSLGGWLGWQLFFPASSLTLPTSSTPPTSAVQLTESPVERPTE